MASVWVHTRGCVVLKERACVGQNICSTSNIQRAAWMSPVQPVIIFTKAHSEKRENTLLVDWILF